MAGGGSKSILWLLLAIVSFVLAVLLITGVIMSDDPVGRWIFGIVFIASGILWVVRLTRPTKPKQ
jgi:uncharacterized membrane protein HdeD (DUF308 family)